MSYTGTEIKKNFFSFFKENLIRFFMFHTNYFIYSENRNDEVFETSTVISQMDQKLMVIKHLY